MNKFATILALTLATAGAAVTASPATAGCGNGCGDYAAGSLSERGTVDEAESDYFQISVVRGQPMGVTLIGFDRGVDVDVIVTDLRGNLVTDWNGYEVDGTSMESNEQFTFVPQQSGLYTVEVRNADYGCTDYAVSVNAI